MEKFVVFYSCQEWDLVSLDDSCAEFTFLEQELELRIGFSKIRETLAIQSVHIQSHLSPGNFHEWQENLCMQ